MAARTELELLEAIHPRPWDWTWEGAHAGGHIYLTDVNGRKIGVLWGKPPEKEAAADLIMSLVNAAGKSVQEVERVVDLKDIVQQMPTEDQLKFVKSVALFLGYDVTPTRSGRMSLGRTV